MALVAAQKDIGIFKKLEVHSLTISGITNTSVFPVGLSFTVNHTLGDVPDFVILYPKQRVIPKDDGTESRIIQFAWQFDIGSKLIKNNYVEDSGGAIRFYTNSSGAKYEQLAPTSSSYDRVPLINNLTATSIQIGGPTSYQNFGIFNGEYWVLIGKIADAYQQGEQVVYDG